MASIASIQEAEFRVHSCVSVREQYKAKLRAYVDALVPGPGLELKTQPLVQPTAAVVKAIEKKKQHTRDAIADRLRVRATLPAGKELHVLGDWLLLLREASVKVVESVVHWRQVVHSDRPLPFEAEHVRGNYLLLMMDDVDFLARCTDLVDWLWFPLIRNPFIINHVGTEAPVHRRQRGKRGERIAPPTSLTTPLVSILPEDDVVDGSRIQAALAILQEEEALYGRHKTVEAVDEYWQRANDTILEVPALDAEDESRLALSLGQRQSSRSIFDAIAVATKTLKASEHRLLLLQRDSAKVSGLIEQLESQIGITTHHGQHDLVSDHTVWQYREHCRTVTLRAASRSLESLRARMSKLENAVAAADSAAIKARAKLSELERDREKQRRERTDSKRNNDEQKERHAVLRQKTMARHRALKAPTRPKKHKPTDSVNEPLPADDTRRDKTIDFANAVGDELDERPDEDRRVELDQRRVVNLARREHLRQQQQRERDTEQRERGRRRDENARMFLEDRRAEMIEQRFRMASLRKAREDRIKSLTALPIFSTVQELGGVVKTNGMETRYRIAVYDHRARGYALDGLRFVAYDPSTCRSYSMLISTREYSSLGYGRTQHGLAAFCHWLFLIYDRRHHQFKLVWSGSPCPPPLRIREYDHTLVCVHKEGIRVHTSASSYRVVTAYIRMSEPASLQLLLSSMSGDATETKLAASDLLPKGSLAVREEYASGPSFVWWAHVANGGSSLQHHYSHSVDSAATRVYSGTLVVNGTKMEAHVFDFSSTEYELHLASAHDHSSTPTVVVLLKHHVNPYGVRLPNSAYGDLLGNLRIEESSATDQGASRLRVHVLPAWRSSLAKYVRAVRMGKFGCQIDGTFFVVVATLVQQKTEFRAHILFELTQITPGGATRISLHISLSDLFRCPDAALTREDTKPASETTCMSCAANIHAEAEEHARRVENDRLTVLENDEMDREACESCARLQRQRVDIVHHILQSNGEDVSAALEFLYYATCDECGVVPPPILIVDPQPSSSHPSGTSFDGLLRHYFHTFAIGDEDSHDYTAWANIAASLDHSRVAVVHTTGPSVLTIENTRALTLRFRAQLQSVESRTPVAFVVVTRSLDLVQLSSQSSDRDDEGFDLDAALSNLGAAIVHIGHQPAVAVDEFCSDEESGGAQFTFESYLVTEALLVEVARVLLHPELEWRLPGETVGASSWTTACAFLQDPQQLSWDLQQRQADLINMADSTREVVAAYEAHPKWPTRLEDVRPPFQALLSTIAHVIHLQHVLQGHGRVLGCSTGSDMGGDIYSLEEGVSVISFR